MINGWWPMVLSASGLPKPLLLTTLIHLRSSLDTGWSSSDIREKCWNIYAFTETN